MAAQNSSSTISSIYNSRKTLVTLMETLGYDVKDYENFSINEINSMYQNKQLDMLLEKNKSPKQTKIYVKYYYACTFLDNDSKLPTFSASSFPLEVTMNPLLIF